MTCLGTRGSPRTMANVTMVNYDMVYGGYNYSVCKTKNPESDISSRKQATR